MKTIRAKPVDDPTRHRLMLLRILCDVWEELNHRDAVLRDGMVLAIGKRQRKERAA